MWIFKHLRINILKSEILVSGKILPKGRKSLQQATNIPIHIVWKVPEAESYFAWVQLKFKDYNASPTATQLLWQQAIWKPYYFKRDRYTSFTSTAFKRALLKNTTYLLVPVPSSLKPLWGWPPPMFKHAIGKDFKLQKLKLFQCNFCAKGALGGLYKSQVVKISFGGRQIEPHVGKKQTKPSTASDYFESAVRGEALYISNSLIKGTQIWSTNPIPTS